MKDCRDLFKEVPFILKFAALLCCFAVALIVIVHNGPISPKNGQGLKLRKMGGNLLKRQQLPAGMSEVKDMAENAAKGLGATTNAGVPDGVLYVSSFGYFIVLAANLGISCFIDLDRYTDVMVTGVGGCMNFAVGTYWVLYMAVVAGKFETTYALIAILSLGCGVCLLLATLLAARDFQELGDLFSSNNLPTLLAIIGLIIQLLATAYATTAGYTPLFNNVPSNQICTIFLPVGLLLVTIVVASFIFPDDEPDDITVAVYLITSGVLHALFALCISVTVTLVTKVVLAMVLAAAGGGLVLAAGILKVL